MPSQKLRLEAEMKDNASPAVKRLRQELSELQAASADTRGVTKLNAELAKLQSEAEVSASPAVRKLRAELAELQKGTAAQQAVAALNKEIGTLRKHSGDIAPSAGMKGFTAWMGEAKGAASGAAGVIGGLPGVLSAIGIGGIAAGSSVAGLASEMKRLGEQGLALRELSRQTGISADVVNRWSHAGEHFGVAGETMLGMLDRFSGQLPDFNRGVGSMFKELSIWPDLVRKMQHEGPANALLDALRQAEEVGKTKGPQVRKQFLDALGLGGEAEKLFGDHGFAGLLEQLQKPWAAPSPEFLKQAQGLRDATSDFNNALREFENTSGPEFLRQMSGLVAGAAKVVGFLGMTPSEAIESLSGSKPNETPDGKQYSYLGGELKIDKDSLPGELAAALNHLFSGSSAPKSEGFFGGNGWFGQGLRQKSSYGGSDLRSLLQNASFNEGSSPAATSQFGTRGLVADGSKEGVLAALREWSLQSDARGGLGGGSGEPGAGDSGGEGGFSSGRRGFMKSGEDGADYGTPSKSLLDFIAKSEGAKDYNTSLGNGRYLPGHHETNLEGMNLKQILGLGKYMRQQPGNPNSSALGRYQMTGETIRDLMGRLHLSGDEKFDGKMQDTLASKLIQDEGPRALNRWASLRGGRMDTALGLLKSGSIASMPGSSYHSGVGLHLHALNEQCVSLAKAAVGASGSVHEWRRGVGALAGTLRPGTPVATFLDRQGRQTERYAGGGSGTPGAHLDHAGIFQSYIRDPRGKIVGMNIAEQYAGSHGVHSKAYYNRGFGEHNASNYSAVVGSDGEYLGGSKNPMNRRATELAATPHPFAGRRADRNLTDPGHAQGGAHSNHLLTIDLRDHGGHVRSTHIQRSGPLRVEMPNRWQTGRNPLIGA